MKTKPIVWSIAGSDSGGSAGIQADLAVFQQLNVHGCSVITAVTAQNNKQISAIHYTPDTIISAQIDALATELKPVAIKLGMLGQSTTIKLLDTFLEKFSGFIVLDPVFISTSGKNLFSMDLKNYAITLQTLFHKVDLLTPNLFEAEILLNRSIQSQFEIEKAANDLLALGAKSILIKGGHGPQIEFSHDYWTNGTNAFWLSGTRYKTNHLHGTGCTLSSAITACLALGYSLKDAIVIGKMYISEAIRKSQKTISLIHSPWPENILDLPYLSTAPHRLHQKFPPCNATPLGLYPIVDDVTWIKKLLPLGVSTIQLRLKNKRELDLQTQIKEACFFSKRYQARLFINDHWELALRFNAYGVHLGQSDLDTVDIQQLSNLRLGISTHCYYEVARAHSMQPSYIACGPIFPTTSKIMPFLPQGLNALARWRRTLDYPIVAIGGINLERTREIVALGIDGIAMISTITEASNPIQTTNMLLKCIEENRKSRQS